MKELSVSPTPMHLALRANRPYLVDVVQYMRGKYRRDGDPLYPKLLTYKEALADNKVLAYMRKWHRDAEAIYLAAYLIRPMVKETADKLGDEIREVCEFMTAYGYGLVDYAGIVRKMVQLDNILEENDI